ncbi:FAD-dependent oxidoreductase [Actinacidiphila alni]|uniref:FAD-dependent oxidoreductase n=1 Tax=Actinacidiphila alni TaxID=380248 RepID=UPI0034548D42
MNRRIVILGNGSTGTLAANRLRRHFDDDGVRIVVVDRDDHRDPEVELLVAIGVMGPHALLPPEDRRLRAGIDFRCAEIGAVDPARQEVCLGDGTTLGYDVLVVATGARPGVPVSGTAPNVFTVGAAGAVGAPVAEGPRAHAAVERLVAAVSGYLLRTESGSLAG